MFRGVTNINLDAKGRLAIPTRYREELADSCDGQLVVTVDRDHCLMIYPLYEWEEIEQKLVKLPSLNVEARKLQRLYIGHATEVELDNSGRMLIPGPLRTFAHLEKQVVLIGQGNKFELWDEQRWNERCEYWLGETDLEANLPPEMESLSL